MQKSTRQNVTLLFSAALIFSLVMMAPPAQARRKTPMRAYSFLTEAGKASQAECDGEAKVPRKLKKMEPFKKSGGYLGSELQDSPLQTDDGHELWKHFFTTKPPCNAVLAKTPSSKDEVKEKKPDLPPEEAPVSEDEPAQPDAQEE